MRKKTISDIETAFSARGYTLLSTGYLGAKGPLKFRCPRGHEGAMTWSNFKHGYGCLECGGRSKIPTEHISAYLRLYGYELLDDSVKNVMTGLTVVCPAGHKTKTLSFSNFKGGNRCEVCSGTKAYTIEDVRKLFYERGFTLLSEEYSNNKSKLHCRCPAGHVADVSLSGFLKAGGCYECSGRKRTPTLKVEQLFSAEGYTVLRGFWDTKGHRVEATCPQGHTTLVLLANFKKGKRCRFCPQAPVSRPSQVWLDSLGISQECREIRLRSGDKKYRVDAYVPETNTVYEFLGDYWHGNPNVFDMDKKNRHTKKTFGQHFDETLEKLWTIKAAGYGLNIIWETDFMKAAARGKYGF